MYYKKVLLFVISALLSNLAFTQTTLSGKIQEKGQAVLFASVGLFEEGKNEPVRGVTTDENGIFVLKEVPNGIYVLKVQHVSYQEYSKEKVIVDGRQSVIRMEPIELISSEKKLEEVEIVSEKEVFESQLGKRVYRVDKDLTSAGGTAIDALRNVPSVFVDENGSVSLRGSSNINILINGKQSGLTGADREAVLDRIPASQIERVELITNPSARYDAAGAAGIINIVLKKPQEKGINGSLTANAGNYDQYNGSGNVNYRKSKWNVYTTINGNQRVRERNVTNLRENLLEEISFLDQSRNNHMRQWNYNISLGTDYAFNDKHSLNVEGNFRKSGAVSYTHQRIENLDQLRELEDFFIRTSSGGSDEENYSLALNYEAKFRNEGQVLKVFANTNDSWEIQNIDYDENSYLPDEQLVSESNILQRSDEKIKNQLHLIQIDYEHPFGTIGRIETGYKSIFRTIQNGFLFEDFNFEQDTWESDLNQSNNFKYDEQVHAAYLIWKGKWGKLEYEAGLRAEQTYVESTLLNTGVSYPNDYFNLFPSGILQFNIDDSQNIQLSYSRRINRPSFRELNPFPNFSNPLSIRVGNPALRPEFIDSYELGYLKDWKSVSFSGSIFYKKQTDIVQTIVELQEDGRTLVRGPQNLAVGENYGLELNGSFEVGKWLKLNADFSYFRVKVEGSTNDDSFSNDNYSWNTRMMAFIKLPEGFSAQVMAFYRAPMVLPQGKRYEFFMNSLGISKSIWKRKGTLTLNVRDIFKTMRFGGEVENDSFKTDFNIRGNTRIIMFGLSYRFGKIIKSKKRPDRDSNGGDGMDEGF